MKLNYSLNSGFASCDGEIPSRENTASWIAWAPVPASELAGRTDFGTTLYLAPRAIPSLSDDTILLGVPLGDLEGIGGIDDLDPQRLSYDDAADASVEVAEPIRAEQVRVVASKDGAGRRQAQNAFAAVDGERQFHIMFELFEQ